MAQYPLGCPRRELAGHPDAALETSSWRRRLSAGKKPLREGYLGTGSQRQAGHRVDDWISDIGVMAGPDECGSR